ncbi:MAG: DUF2252 family protein [Rhizomicrobium sp.]
MNIVEATRRYEAWLGEAVPLVSRDLKLKHDTMRASAFGFLRATYYRWAQQFAKTCPEAARAPSILIVGDLHLENFGTWRDGEARLAWGINDFDEAHRGAYANDLVRLAASALIAIAEGSLYIGAERAAAEILTGYAQAMAQKQGVPFVLEEDNTELRALAMSDARSPKKFWRKILAEKDAPPPADAKALLEEHLPKGEPDIAFKRRTAGAGSLGLPRFVATRLVNGSRVAREAKARAPAAHAWASGGAHDPSHTQALLARAIRPQDPFLHVGTGWIVRRLAPHCENIALADIADAAERRAVLNAMGRETANIHRGTPGARARILKHLDKQKDGWLFEAAATMAEAVRKDWKVWKKRG